MLNIYLIHHHNLKINDFELNDMLQKLKAQDHDLGGESSLGNMSGIRICSIVCVWVASIEQLLLDICV